MSKKYKKNNKSRIGMKYCCKTFQIARVGKGGLGLGWEHFPNINSFYIVPYPVNCLLSIILSGMYATIAMNRRRYCFYQETLASGARCTISSWITWCFSAISARSSQVQCLTIILRFTEYCWRDKARIS